MHHRQCSEAASGLTQAGGRVAVSLGGSAASERSEVSALQLRVLELVIKDAKIAK